MRLHFLDGGKLEMNILDIVNDQTRVSNEKVVIPVIYNLIEHSEGLVLFDTGNALEAANNSEEYWGIPKTAINPIMTEENFVIEQIKKNGFKAEDIKYVVMSHLHLDHSGGIGYFPNASYIVQKEELYAAYNPLFFEKDAYIRADFDKNVEWFVLSGSNKNSFDIFSDGKLKIISTSGHTSGHQSLLIDLKNSGKILLAGDAVHLHDSLDRDLLPSQGLLNNASSYVSSVAKLRFMRKSGVKLFVGHDPIGFDNITFLD